MTMLSIVQDTINVLPDTVVTTVDSVIVPTIPPITDVSTLIQYWIALAAGLAAGYVVKFIQKLSVQFAQLNNIIQTVVLGTISFGILKLSQLLGVALPGNPFEWNETVVSTLIATGCGLLIVKLKKEPAPTEPTP